MTVAWLEELISPVAASFIVLIVLAAWRACWTHFLINIWLRITCRHITDISGEWEYKYERDDLTRREHIVVEQYGWKIRGTIRYIYQQVDQPPTHEAFKFDGILRNDILCAYYWNKDRRRKGCGSFSLQLCESGGLLTGGSYLYDSADSRIVNEDYSWRRKGSE